jgi:iron complex transport system ATP-binding protein
MVGLLGPNGSGKTTLLRLAAGVLAVRSGSIHIAGDDVGRLARREIARRVAVLPQDFSVQFAYTVRQIVEMGRLPYGDIWGSLRRDDHAAVAAALEATDTASLADRVYNELSGGERQRVLVALALAQGSPLVLLDEPTAHLDIKHQVDVLELLRRLNRERGLTVVAALHDLNLAARYFPRLVLFRRTILADGPPVHVLDGTRLSAVYETPVRVGILPGEEHLSVLPVVSRSDLIPEGPATSDDATADKRDR